jgi:hypothetical protein
MTRFVEIFRKLFELRLANYNFFSKINILNNVVLLCIEFVILLIEEKVMSYVTVSEGHGYPLVRDNAKSALKIAMTFVRT